MEEEEDPVVQEIPVYLSKALAENLYIYQFPVRPANREWKDVQVVNASIKPKNQIVRLEVGLDTYCDKYCSSKGEQIALNTDGYEEPGGKHTKDKDKERSQYFKHGVMDKIVYESSNPGVNSDRYAIAILQDKEMHCTPINGIVQLRPSCSYFDKQEKRKKEIDKAENSEEDEEEEAPQQVTVKFARQETDVAKKAREKSFDFISKRALEEPWYDALWRHCDTDHADLERLKLFSEDTGASVGLSLSGADYVRSLVPPPPPDEADSGHNTSRNPHELLKELLLSAKIMSFSDLRSIIKTETGPMPEASLLTALTTSACCVRGLWTARSTDLYTQATPPPKLMSAARDHVLYLFTQNQYIDRRKIQAAVRLPPQEVLHIIRSVAKFNSRSSGWELLIPPDTAFEAKYPDVVSRQHMYLEGRQRLFNEMMLSENVPKRQRKKSQRDSVSSDTLLSPKVRCNSVSDEDSESRKRAKNKSGSGLGKRTRNASSCSVHEGT